MQGLYFTICKAIGMEIAYVKELDMPIGTVLPLDNWQGNRHFFNDKAAKFASFRLA
jgi:hypothetical protein